MKIPRPLPLLLCFVAAGCGGGDSGESARAADTSAAPAGSSEPVAWTVTPRGIGTIRVGATVREALGREVEASSDPEACEYVWSSSTPAGVQLMSVGGRIARVDVTEGETATAEGAKIGHTEAQVRQMYAGRVREEPHKYVQGKYLVVVPSEAADSAYRIVFETDGSTVTRYRAGKVPEVEWVEGCS